MEDPSFKNSFDAANPGLMEKLKALVSAMTGGAGGAGDAGGAGGAGGADGAGGAGSDAENKAALLPSPDDLAKNMDEANALKDANGALNAATALDLLNGGGMDPAEFIELSKDNLEEKNSGFDSDKQAIATIDDAANNPNITAKDTAIALITQSPMAVPVKDALDEMMAKIDNLTVATSMIAAAASDPAFIDNMVDADLAKGLSLSPEEMKNAMNAAYDANDKAASAIMDALVSAGAVSEKDAADIVTDMLANNKDNPEILAALGEEGSNTDKLESSFDASSPPQMGSISQNAAHSSIASATDEQIANAYAQAASNPDFLNAIQENDENVAAKMADALSSKLASLANGSDTDTAALADAFNQMSMEDLMNAIKATLNTDTPDAYLSKTLDGSLVNVNGFKPEMAEKMLATVNNETGLGPNDLLPALNSLLSGPITPDTGRELIKASKDGLGESDKDKLALSLAMCMNDPRFKAAFESANPGLLSNLGDKELLARMLSNLKDLDDLKNAKNMLKGAGALDQEAELDQSMQDLLNRFMNDLDGLAAEVVSKKATDFASKIMESHNMRDGQALQGLVGREDDEKEVIPDKKGPSVEIDVESPTQIPYASNANPNNAEILMNEEFMQNLILALRTDELLVKGVKFNLVNPREIDDIKRDMVNK